MARVDEFTAIFNASTTAPSVPVPRAVAVGRTVVLSVVTASSALVTVTATDSRGNTYLRDHARQTATSGGGYQLRSKLTTALQPGDTINITLSAPSSKTPVIAGVYDDDLAAHVAGSLGSAADSGGSTSSVLNSGNFTPAVGDLLVGTVTMISAGRTFTADAGWSQSTKLVTTSGSGDRGVVQMWRYAAAATPQAASGLFTAGGSALWGIMGEAYALDAGDTRSGRLWLGDTAYPTLLDGVEYPWSVDGVLSK